MIKLEDFNSEKFLVKEENAFQTMGGQIPTVTLTGTTWTTDKVHSCGEVECGGDTEFEHTDTCTER